MNLIGRVRALLGLGQAAPAGTVRVCDPSRLNWLYVTYNTTEELVRVSPAGATVPAAMTGYTWADDRTLDVAVRKGNRFPGGEPVTAATVRKAFDEVMRWAAPHPPGTHFNLHPGTTCEVTGEYAVRFRFPEVDGPAVGEAAGDAPDERRVLGRPRVRVRPERDRRGEVVSGRRGRAVGHRAVHPGRG